MLRPAQSARPIGRFALAGAANPALLALVVMAGALGFAIFATLLLLRPPSDAPPADRGAALRSLVVVPFATDDASLGEVAPRLTTELARTLAHQMPHVRIATSQAGDARLQLDGEMWVAGDDVEVVLRVRDRRDGRLLAEERDRLPRAMLDAAAVSVASDARRAVTAAMFRLAAEE